jgi:isovaleryl-CoA dehydrogenase
MFLTGMKFALGDELEALRETAHKFAQQRIAPRAHEIDETNTFPNDLWVELGKLGLLGITADPEFGGIFKIPAFGLTAIKNGRFVEMDV